ncbi:B12-binding domain-containing radical SAM protein [Actinomadura soli]|uniref:B12-binding domain-containing radical SAM protein n=1 Tax=Actinomadura soli TaxID=2508997 RepID=UPI001486C0F9|nr:radical SAM protein [Actinomadura soli]
MHAPYAAREVPGRDLYWERLDDRYYPAHPRARRMRRVMWELPHWIPWLAGVVATDGTFETATLNLYVDGSVTDGIDEELVRREVSRCPGDVYLFSPMTVNLPQALRVAEIVKEEYPRARTVFGGIVATPLRAELARHRSVDVVVHGPGEEALMGLLTAFASGADWTGTGNLAFDAGAGRVHVTPARHDRTPLSSLPFPKVDVFDPSVGGEIRYIRQNYALGCPFRCDFCTIQTIGRRPQYALPDRVFAEIDAYRDRYGAHHSVYFGDETFTLNTDRTLDICALLARRGDVHFDCQTRLNCLNDVRLPSALYAAGCRWLEVGLESLNQATQDSMKQWTRLGALREILRRLRDAGLLVCTYTIIGLPVESRDDMCRTVDQVAALIDEGLLTASYVSVFVPYPGTSYFAAPERHGMRLHHREFDRYHEELPPVFDTPLATPDEVYSVYLDALRKFGGAMESGALNAEVS